MTGNPVVDWASDYDVFDPGYITNPFPVWDELRSSCPVAHTERLGGSWLPTTYEDVCAMARDPRRFSSIEITVVPPDLDDEFANVKAAPIQSDPPEHTWSRRLLLPAFAPRAVTRYEQATQELCNSLIDGFIDRSSVDAAVEYAQQIPVRVIAAMLGIAESMSDTFTDWVRGVLEFAAIDPELAKRSRVEALTFLHSEIIDRKAHPGDDLISYLLAQEVDGEPVPDLHVLGTCGLLLVAGADTTWSSIGSALWHLASHDADRKRLVAEPELVPNAIEEFLRAYSPVTMARIVAEDTDVGSATMRAGDRVLMAFPAANRDPNAFEDADQVIIDRERNRHVAFGAGIHRCVGSNLARMEMRIAIETWLARIPEFHLEDPSAVTWAGGQVRGPRHLPVTFP